MAHAYQAVGWNRQKKIYDAVLWGAIVAYVALFMGVGATLHPDATAETLVIRALGTAALLLLHVLLSVGPLCRLNRRFLPLLYNRRHMGVTMFGLALAHGAFALVQFHALGDRNPLVSLLVSNTRVESLAQFPFQPLGALALVILFLMAATSHDFWLTNLTAPVWKALHMLVYLAYALVVLHVVLGVLQAETSPWLASALGAGLFVVLGLHLVTALSGRRLDRPVRATAAREPSDAFVRVATVDEIPEGRAKVVTLGGERVAVYRYDGQVSAVSGVCQHQNGPLGEGRIIDGCITCPWHGYQYLPDCGRSPAPFDERVPTFRVRVEGRDVWVDPRPLPVGTAVPPASIAGSGPERAPEPGLEPASEAGDFYVGYLAAAPPALARWTRRRVAALILLALGLSLGLVAAQRPFARSWFEFGTVRALEGWARLDPEPCLLVERPGGGHTRFLMVGTGKHGARDEMAPFDGERVRLEGTLVYRGDRSMIELATGSVVPAPAGSPPPATGWSEDLGVHRLVGEIVDSKCFLGVMKPGHLKPHRACATRCISGGIPPVLLTRDPQGRATCFLLVSERGEPVGPAVLDFVAEPVEIYGRVLRYDDLLVLRADPEDISRID